MRSREESSLKTDALRYLADALSEDIAATPEAKILAEERDDSTQRPPLALAFEELLADAKALARKRGTVPTISRVDTLGADTGTPLETLLRRVPENFSDSQAPLADFDDFVGRNAVLGSGPEQAADSGASWARQAIPALLGRLMARLQTRTALSAIATLLLVAVLAPALYERFAEHPGGFSPSSGSPLVQREEFPGPDSSPLPPQPQTAPSQRPANVEAVPQLPRVSTLPAMPPELRLRQPQNPIGTSETASAAPGAQQVPDSAQPQPPASASPPEASGAMQPVAPAVRRIASFLDSYNGGDCFLIIPLKIAEGDTSIEVYGGSHARFAALDGEFARENGFRAGMSRYQVTDAQCGAVNFVRRLRNQNGTARRLDIRTDTLASGPVLSGTVGGFGGENLELLLVGADGRVEKLRSLLMPSGQTAQPQLLVAIVSALPVEAVRPAVLDKADRLFDAIFAETQLSNNMVNATVKYFKLE
jgi:serine/threonine-protein kinase